MTNSATEYQGHPSWEHWNAALWVGNDEGLYIDATSMGKNEFRDYLMEFDYVTPDGCTFTEELAGYAWDLVNED